MNSFKDFNITIDKKPFTGDKIKIDRILNREIIVSDFKIEKSKYAEKGNGYCLNLQIEVDGMQRIVFTGSVILQEAINKIPRDKLPFKTTIIKENEAYRFT